MVKKKVEAVSVEVTAELISPLVEQFGNGDLNTLRDKVNEIIKVINE